MDSFEPLNTAPGLRKSHLVILSMLLVVGLCVVGVTGYFRLGSDSAALRSSLMKSVAGQWHKTIAVHVGGLTMSVLRTGLRWVKFPAEPRAALEALRGPACHARLRHGTLRATRPSTKSHGTTGQKKANCPAQCPPASRSSSHVQLLLEDAPEKVLGVCHDP